MGTWSGPEVVKNEKNGQKKKRKGTNPSVLSAIAVVTVLLLAVLLPRLQLTPAPVSARRCPDADFVSCILSRFGSGSIGVSQFM